MGQNSRALTQMNLDAGAQLRCQCESHVEGGSMQTSDGLQEQRSIHNGAGHSSGSGRSGSSVEQKMYDTLSRVHKPSAQQDKDSHVIDMPAEDHESSSFPLQCPASVVCCCDAPGSGKANTLQGKAPSGKADLQDLRRMETGGTDDQTEQKRGGVVGSRQTRHSRKSSSSQNGDELFNQDCMLTPSSFACECDPETAPDKLADIYTGQQKIDFRFSQICRLTVDPWSAFESLLIFVVCASQDKAVCAFCVHVSVCPAVSVILLFLWAFLLCCSFLY